MWNKIISSNWSPWITGAVIAVIFSLILFILNKPFGTLNDYVDLINAGKAIYYGEHIQWSWGLLFIIGIFIGAFVASLTGKNFKLELIPEDHFKKGSSYYLTIGPILSFIGGFLVMAGLIIAGNSFLKLWSDCLSLYMSVIIFIIIMFILSVIIGTLLTIKIEEKKK